MAPPPAPTQASYYYYDPNAGSRQGVVAPAPQATAQAYYYYYQPQQQQFIPAYYPTAQQQQEQQATTTQDQLSEQQQHQQQPDAGGEEEGSSIGAADGDEKQLSVDDQQQQQQPAVITADASDESGGKTADGDGGRKRPGLIAKLTTPIQKKNPDLVDHHGKEHSTSMEKGIGLMEGGQEDSSAHQGNNDDKGAAVHTGFDVKISASSVPGESNVAQHQGATTDTYADDHAKKATTTTPSSSDAGLVHQKTPRSEVAPAGTAVAAAATSVSPSSPSTARKPTGLVSAWGTRLPGKEVGNGSSDSGNTRDNTTGSAVAAPVVATSKGTIPIHFMEAMQIMAGNKPISPDLDVKTLEEWEATAGSRPLPLCQEHPALRQPRYRPMGMKNPSQTRVCYLNAMIQVLLPITGLMTYLSLAMSTMREKEKDKYPWTRAIASACRPFFQPPPPPPAP
ncbi:AarF domain containing kinase 2, partial [Perkinsus olseni]